MTPPAQEYDFLFREIERKAELLEQSIATLNRLNEAETDETIGTDLERALEYLRECRVALAQERIGHYQRLIKANEPENLEQWP